MNCMVVFDCMFNLVPAYIIQISLCLRLNRSLQNNSSDYYWFLRYAGGQTDTQTHMLIAILRKHHWNEVVTNGSVLVHENRDYV